MVCFLKKKRIPPGPRNLVMSGGGHFEVKGMFVQRAASQSISVSIVGLLLIKLPTDRVINSIPVVNRLEGREKLISSKVSWRRVAGGGGGGSQKRRFTHGEGDGTAKKLSHRKQAKTIETVACGGQFVVCKCAVLCVCSPDHPAGNHEGVQYTPVNPTSPAASVGTKGEQEHHGTNQQWTESDRQYSANSLHNQNCQ